MSMPPPMNESAYRDHVSAINTAAELVCKKSMINASQQTKQFYEAEEMGSMTLVFRLMEHGDAEDILHRMVWCLEYHWSLKGSGC